MERERERERERKIESLSEVWGSGSYDSWDGGTADEQIAELLH